jgi:molybdate transport system substrate-binding protein
VTLVATTSPVLMRRIEGGETADLLVIQPDFVARLLGTGQVLATGRAAIGRVGVGLAVRQGVVLPAIDTVAMLRESLLAADAVVFNNVASGNRFAEVLVQLGLAEALQSRILRAPPAEVFRRVLEGQGQDIAVGTMTQIRATPGLALLGPLPGAFQSWLDYEAVVMAATPHPEAAHALIAFLRGPEARAAFAAAGGVPATD